MGGIERFFGHVMHMVLILTCCAGVAGGGYLLVRDDLGARADRDRAIAATAAVQRKLDAAAQQAVADASAADRQCSTRAADALRAGIAIARMAAPRARTSPHVQPEVRSAEINAIIHPEASR